MQDVEKQESVRPFVISILLVVASCLSLMALFNWWTDPFVVFNHPARPGVNDHLSQAFFKSPRDQQMSWLIHRGRQAQGSDILLGASQTILGINTCSYPRLQRLSLFGLQEGEVVEFLKGTDAYLSPGTRLFINLTYAGEEAPLPEDTGIMFLWRNLLQSTTTTVGFANLLQSYRATQPVCATRSFPKEMKPGYQRDHLQNLQYSEVEQKHAVNVLFASLAPVCEKGNIEIRLFNLPVDFDPSVADEVYAYFQYEKGLVLAAQRTLAIKFPTCKVSFKDLASEYTAANRLHGPPQNDWWDTTHFKPAVGDRLLAEILDVHGE